MHVFRFAVVTVIEEAKDFHLSSAKRVLIKNPNDLRP